MELDLLTTLANETLLLIPATSGAVVRFGTERIVTTAGQTVRLSGSGPVLISKGSAWTNRARYAGEYNGPYFDGSTPSTVGTNPTGLSYQGNVSAGSYVFLNADTLRAHTSTNKEAWETGTDVSGDLDYPPAGPLQITPSAQTDGTHYAVKYTLPAAKNAPDAVAIRAERKFI